MNTAYGPAKRRFVLLDRDGTVIVEKDHLSDPSQVQLIAGAAEGLRAMSRGGLGLAIITNQSVVGRGVIDQRRLDSIHKVVREVLQAEGIAIEGIYACPHRANEGCRCRKPMPGLIERAALELGFASAEAFIVGDKECDVEVARAVGATAILVRTGYGAVWAARGLAADYIVDDLQGAAAVIEGVVRRQD